MKRLSITDKKTAAIIRRAIKDLIALGYAKSGSLEDWKIAIKWERNGFKRAFAALLKDLTFSGKIKHRGSYIAYVMYEANPREMGPWFKDTARAALERWLKRKEARK